MDNELDFDALADAIDTIYRGVGQLEAELAELEDDFDDEWDDEWSAIVPDEEDDMEEANEDIELVDESVRRKRVVRGGKRVVKYKTNKPGYRVKYVNGRPREVRMKPQERRKRKKGQRRAVRKKRAKRAQINRKRKRSMRKRTSSMNTRRRTSTRSKSSSSSRRR
jgi:hypothetical protein